MRIKEYKLEIGLSIILFFIPIFLEFFNKDLSLEWKVLSFIIGALGIIPLMFIIFENKYRSYYMTSIFKYKGQNHYIFDLLRLSLESYSNNNNGSITCSICLQDKFIIDLLQKGEIKQWDSVDSMGKGFWDTNKDNEFLNNFLIKKLTLENIDRVPIENEKLDFAIATLYNGNEIVFTENIEASTREAKIYFDPKQIELWKTNFNSIKDSAQNLVKN